MWLTRLPSPIRDALEGYASDGENLRTSSESAVFRFVRGDDALILKCTRSRTDAPLADEAAAMGWLAGKLDVPRVVCHCVSGDEQYLLVTCLSGLPGHDSELHADKGAVVELFARGLQAIHALDPAGCPADRTPDALVERGRRRIAEDRVPREWVEETGLGTDPTEVLDELERTKPEVERRVFCHGDYCLPNIMIDRGRIAGFIDLGHAGVGDPYRDYVAAHYTIRRNLGEAWIAPFFDRLGVTLDETRRDWYAAIKSFE